MLLSRREQWVATLVCLGVVSGSIFAAKPLSKQRISFRTVKPVAGHFQTKQEAVAAAKTLKQIGCATKTAEHNGHIDVTYECRFWRSLTLNDAAEVQKWNKWLTAKGFAVVHNTPPKDHPEAVTYRLANWRTLHLHKPEDTKSHVEMFKMLGCEVQRSRHNGHDDVKYRCGTWKGIGVASHQHAHTWMQALRRFGFEVRHEH